MKQIVENCSSVSTVWLKKHGFFCGYRGGVITWRDYRGKVTRSISLTACVLDEKDEDYVQFRYTKKGVDCDYRVSLTATACHFGGYRYWFVCPLCWGGRAGRERAGTLYLPPGASYFGCRHCYDLSYQSRNDSFRGRWQLYNNILNMDRQRKELLDKTKRYFYGGKPTRNARKLHTLVTRLDTVHKMVVDLDKQHRMALEGLVSINGKRTDNRREA